MTSLAVSRIAEITAGVLNEAAQGAVPDVSVTGFVVDSRLARSGDLFVAIRGERVDGHDFAAQAIAGGAVAILSQRDLVDVPCIVVADPVLALGAIAAWYRQNVLQARVIALTGSSGKTTTKDLIAQTLEGRVVAAHGSFNTEVGVPLTILQADENTEFLVLEMGMRGIGHIRYLADLADPDVAVVLNVGSAHLGMMKDPADIAQAKGEIVDGLRSDAIAILNADDPQVAAMAKRTHARIIWFGEGATNDVCALKISIDPQGRPGFELAIRGDDPADVQLSLHGEHFVSAALAAASVGHAVGMATSRIAERLTQSKLQSPWRMEVGHSRLGVTVINDAYNANPESMRAALKTLRSMPVSGRTWAVLGEMRELGDASLDEHDALGRLAVRLDISRLVCIGAGTKVMHLAASNEGSWGEESTWVPDIDSAIDVLDAQLQAGDVVLVKASRAEGLERIAAHLLSDSSESEVSS